MAENQPIFGFDVGDPVDGVVDYSFVSGSQFRFNCVDLDDSTLF